MREIHEIKSFEELDYYPFGMLLNGRNWISGSGYRYGFNGKENDDEISVEASQLDFGNRIYNSRIGRFLSVDIKTKQFNNLSPYCFAANSPILYIDQDGNGPADVIKMLNKLVSGLDIAIDGVKSLSEENDGDEYSAMITTIAWPTYDPEKKKLTLGTKEQLENIRTDGSEDKVGFDYDVNYIAIGKLHTHKDDAMPPSPDDVLNLKNDIKKEGFVSILDAGSVRYALVIEDADKAKEFFKKNPNLDKNMYILFQKFRADSNLSDAEIQRVIVATVLEDSGIGFYETTDEQKTEFEQVKLDK